MKRSERESRSTGSTHLRRVSLTNVRPREAFAGADIVHEVPVAQALPLLSSYRSVMAWALAAPQERPELFPAGAAQELRGLVSVTPLPDELRAALENVAELLEDPVAMSGRRVADACVQVAEWAERRGDAPSTAFRFVQAAGMCAPNDARLAYRAGVAARQRALWEVAELWFRHAISVGRRMRDWKTHATAYLGLGNNFMRQGRYAAAQREHLKALRVAKRHGLQEVQGKACHDLFVVAIETGDAQKAEEYGRAAFYAYGAEHPIVPVLAHDIAYFWSLQGQFSRSLPVYGALRPHMRDRENRLRVLASAGRAAGGAGDRDTFMEIWAAAWEMAPLMDGTAVLVTSMLELALGAADLLEWDHALTAAERAASSAQERGEEDVVAKADSLMQRIRRERHVRHAFEDGRSSSIIPEHEPLVADLVLALSRNTLGR
jgi:tetratricopeptide (TPR) repeat protein